MFLHQKLESRASIINSHRLFSTSVLVVFFAFNCIAAFHELYSTHVDCHAIERLDELEGVSKGNYLRQSIVVFNLEVQPFVEHKFTHAVDVVAHAYFAAPSYAFGLGEVPHIEALTEQATYVPTLEWHFPLAY